MKQYLSPEQTAKLIELGLADSIREERYKRGSLPKNYSIGELIEMLPENVAKENEMPSTLNISLMNGEWCVQYADFLGTDFEFCNTELVDALYDMILRLKEEDVI